MRNRKPVFRKTQRAPLPWSVSAGTGLILAAVVAGMARRSPAFSSPLYALAVAVLIVSVMASIKAAAFSRRRTRLLEAHRDLASVKKLSWQDFELIVAEAYRRSGYAVQEVGQGGADGGVDLVLSRGGKTTLVQCKRWQSNVGAPMIREMFGLLVHHGAQEAKIVSASGFTKAAREFVVDKPVELVDGEALLVLIDSVRTNRKAQSTVCLCGAYMTKRQSGTSVFLGCSRYPDCRVTKTYPA